MATIIYPNMNMAVPVVGVEIGPAWANDINACLRVIDNHDHAPGSGVQVTPAGLSINSDLPFGTGVAVNNATFLRSVRFIPQGAVFSQPADIGCLYEVGADLYYSDGAGNQVRITQGGAVTGATGTITGLPSGTASASYAGGTFRFESATNTPANMAVGPLIMGANVASPNTVTLSAAAATPASYALTLPAAAPTAENFLVSDGAGNFAWRANPITAAGNFDLAAPGAGTFYARLSDGFADSVTLLLNQNQAGTGRTWALKTRMAGAVSQFRIGFSAAVGGNVDGNTGYTDSLFGSNDGSWYIGPPGAIGSGTFPGSFVVGRDNGTAVGTGGVGEVRTATFAGVASPASGFIGPVGTILAPPGLWAVSVGSQVNNANSITGNTNIRAALSNTPGSLTGVGPLGFGTAAAYVPNAPVPTAVFPLLVGANVIGPTSLAGTLYYFNVVLDFVGASPTWSGTIQLVRIG